MKYTGWKLTPKCDVTEQGMADKFVLALKQIFFEMQDL